MYGLAVQNQYHCEYINTINKEYMPELVFNNKFTKAFKQSVSSKAEKTVGKISPTCFTLPNVNDKEFSNDWLKVINPVVEHKTFYIRDYDWFVKNKICVSGTANFIIDYIMKNIEFNSNVIKIKVEDIADILDKGRQTIYDALAELDENHIIKFTDIKGVYVVNHNAIFKGNLALFLSVYYKTYGPKNSKIKITYIPKIDYIEGTIKENYKLCIKQYVAHGIN